MSTDTTFNVGDPKPNDNAYSTNGKIMLTTLVALFAAVLVVVFVHLYCRWRLLRRHSYHHHSRRRRHRQLVFAAASTATTSRRGLDPTVLKTLPVIVFSSSGDGEDEAEEVVECAVCLNEFEEGEKVRQLPGCGHRFHLECIDMWFHSNSTCPLCRSAVEAPPPPQKAEVTAVVPEFGGAGTAESSSGEREEELKSPASGMALLRRILSMELRGRRVEADLERGEVVVSLPASPRPPAREVLGRE